MAWRGAIMAGALGFAAAASPAAAGEYWRTRQAIGELQNYIAYLEADPQTDDGYRAPLIRRARQDIERLRARLPRAEWRWRDPCCYSRPPISIR